MPKLTMLKLNVPACLSAAGFAAALAWPSFLAAADGERARNVEEVVVTATRGERVLSEVPRSITLISREEIQAQLNVTNDIGELLGNLVPGMGVSIAGRTNSSGLDMIRGRRVQVVLDGVVLNNGFLDFREDLNNLDPDLIERIEVIRGGSAAYGFGAAGGVILISTRRPEPGESFQTTRIGMNFQPTEIGDSLGGNVSHAFNWSTGDMGFRLSAGYVYRGEVFDGDGDPRPSHFSLDETRDYSVSGGWSWVIDQRSRFDLSASFHDSAEYDKSIPIGANPAEGIKATPLRVGKGRINQAVAERVDSARPSMRRQYMTTASYDHSEVLGSLLNVTGYYMRRESRSDTLIFNIGAEDPEDNPVGFNTPELDRSGLRSTFDTPIPALGEKAGLQWGADFEYSKYTQPNNAGVLPNSPDITGIAWALFTQLETSITEDFRFVGGVRYESLRARIPTFTVSEVMSNRGNVVQGGSRTFDEFISNAAFLYDFNPMHTAYVAFSQGFTSAEILRAIRNTGASSVREAIELEPQIIDNYEVGLRGMYQWWSFNLAAFYSRSSLGVTFVLDPETLLSSVERAPERIWGAELTADARRLPNNFRLGGAISWQEGERKDDNGDWVDLPGNRISPLKVTSHIGQQPRDWLGWRVQALFTDSRDKFPGSTVPNEGRVSSVLLFDASGTFSTRIGDVSLGVRNLLDKQYIPPFMQGLNVAGNYWAAAGRTVTLQLRTQW